MGNGKVNALPHILTPFYAAWSGWTMLILLLSAVLAEMWQPGVISQAALSLVAQSDRTYKAAPTNLLGQIMISIFRIGTIGMALCLCLYEQGNMHLTSYLAICGVVLAVLLVKMLCNAWIDFTFMLSRRFDSAYEHFGNIVTLATLVLYPALLVVRVIGSVEIGRWVILIIAALFILVWLYRSARMCISSIPSVLYLVLYILTMDCLPMAIMVYLSSQTLLYI